jgi:hypothetical protein
VTSEVVTDGIGRASISRSNARLRLDEQRESVARKREAAEAAERQAIEADRRRRAQLWGGIPADQVPEGSTPAQAMVRAEYEAQPRRTSVLEEALSNQGGFTFHPLPSAADES